MSKLYCPYCNPNYQFYKTDSSGNLYCGLCGEYLIRKNLISIKMIVSIVSIFSIVLPIFIILLYAINNYMNEKTENYQVNTLTIMKLLI